VKAILIALATASTLYGAVELYDVVVPEVSKTSATHQAELIADAAYMTFSLGELTWEDALDDAVTTSRHDDNITVTGTVVRWENSVECWQFDIPTPDSKPEAEPCR
jgi:hypothetical protein